MLPSCNLDYTFIINEENHNLPVFSVITDHNNLWDWNSGIYVSGPNADTSYPYFGSNFWQPWSKKSRMEFFDKSKNKQFDAQFDLEIHGPTVKGHRYKTFSKLPINSMLFFQSYYWHRVRPVTNGVRKSMVGWVLGPKFK